MSRSLDDTKIYAKTSDCDSLQDDLISISDWANKWNLTFNVDKCKVIHYGYNDPENQYPLNNNYLKSATEENDLGVLFERDLKFSKHISTKINNLRQTASCLLLRGLLILLINTYL